MDGPGEGSGAPLEFGQAENLSPDTVALRVQPGGRLPSPLSLRPPRLRRLPQRRSSPLRRDPCRWSGCPTSSHPGLSVKSFPRVFFLFSLWPYSLKGILRAGPGADPGSGSFRTAQAQLPAHQSPAGVEGVERPEGQPRDGRCWGRASPAPTVTAAPPPPPVAPGLLEPRCRPRHTAPPPPLPLPTMGQLFCNSYRRRI